jgi:hypothetical protein
MRPIDIIAVIYGLHRLKFGRNMRNERKDSGGDSYSRDRCEDKLTSFIVKKMEHAGVFMRFLSYLFNWRKGIVSMGATWVI